MADEVYEFQVTVIPGTVPTSPVLVPLTMPVCVVEKVDWHMPRGMAGLFGWQLSMGAVQVLPTAGVTWQLGDGREGTWAAAGLPDSGAWQVTAYNQGNNPHTLYLRFHTHRPREKTAQLPQLAPWQLSPAPDLSKLGPPLRARQWPS